MQSFTKTVADAHSSMGSKDFLQAQELFETALGLAQNGVSLNSYLECLYGLSAAYMETGDWDKAEAIESVALATIDKQLGKAHHLYGSRLNNMATIRKHQGRFKEAESLLLQAIQVIEKHYNATAPELIKPLTDLGQVYDDQKQPVKAEQSWDRAINICEKHFGPNDPGIKHIKEVRSKATSGVRKTTRKSAPPSGGAGVKQISLF